MPNIKQTIDEHNKTKLSQTGTTSKESTCNCRKKEECPMSTEKNLVQSIVYQATVSTNDNSPPQTYVGLTENFFKLDITTTKRHLLCTRKGTPLKLVICLAVKAQWN